MATLSATRTASKHELPHGQLVLPLPDSVLEARPAPRRPAGPRFHPRSEAPAEPDEGGCFYYGRSLGIFLGRVGFGPLRVAWDTDVLIDWRDYGDRLLDGADLPHYIEAKYRDELEALGTIMGSTWMTRDIRIYPLTRQLRDLGPGRSVGRRAEIARERARQLDEIASAMWCVGLQGEFRRGSRHHPARDWQATCMKRSTDRALVEEAVVRGCHVFLTRDRKILAKALYLRQMGLLVVSPTGLLDELALSGELGMVAGADGCMCDNHKWQHLKRACRAAA